MQDVCQSVIDVMLKCDMVIYLWTPSTDCVTNRSHSVQANLTVQDYFHEVLGRFDHIPIAQRKKIKQVVVYVQDVHESLNIPSYLKHYKAIKFPTNWKYIFNTLIGYVPRDCQVKFSLTEYQECFLHKFIMLKETLNSDKVDTLNDSHIEQETDMHTQLLSVSKPLCHSDAVPNLANSNNRCAVNLRQQKNNGQDQNLTRHNRYTSNENQHTRRNCPVHPNKSHTNTGGITAQNTNNFPPSDVQSSSETAINDEYLQHLNPIGAPQTNKHSQQLEYSIEALQAAQKHPQQIDYHLRTYNPQQHIEYSEGNPHGHLQQIKSEGNPHGHPQQIKSEGNPHGHPQQIKYASDMPQVTHLQPIEYFQREQFTPNERHHMEHPIPRHTEHPIPQSFDIPRFSFDRRLAQTNSTLNSNHHTLTLHDQERSMPIDSGYLTLREGDGADLDDDLGVDPNYELLKEMSLSL